ncbi:biotin carboxylase [Actinoplanes octamycinicus]|uniref:Biotin carboxylase n=1 Tax=Actinoplanes octamycinicus TaxID=135948 RepID=A0A7W7GVL9_9ACTN|nr:ATP-grasp domain-containing protein [Actinoplanes octamycinicus]MBB4739145.1 biotin carboxylase [Actinoplanes octamycinicus]GIE58880.1 argininosuccinate lyase [Actinoplanes octamycinicus]
MTGFDGALLILVESNGTYGRMLAQRALRGGAQVRLLTRDPRWYGYLAEDGYPALPVNTLDPAAVLDVVAGLRAAHPGPVAVTAGYEPSLATAATVARRLGLPGPDPDAVARAAGKDRMRVALAAAGVRTPRFRIATDAAQVRAAVADLGAPVVVKPVSSGGSVGVRWCPDAATAAAHAGTLLGALDERGAVMPHRVLVEEYLTGREYSVELFDGVAYGVTGKHVTAPPVFIETGHDFPVRQPAAAALAERAARALGVTWGPAHLEVKVDDTGPAIIETNPRLAGGGLTELVEWCTDHDLYGATLARLLGRDGPGAPPARRAGAIRSAVAPHPQRVTRIDAATARHLPRVRQVTVHARPGDRCGGFGDARDRLVTVAAVAPGAAAAAVAAQRGLVAVRVTTTSPEALLPT